MRDARRSQISSTALPLSLLPTFSVMYVLNQSLNSITLHGIALVVGNSSYVHVPALDNPMNDAKLMADTLRELGFTLIGGGAQLDLDMNGFEHAVQEFGAKLQGADVGLFYYAGHGVETTEDAVYSAVARVSTFVSSAASDVQSGQREAAASAAAATN